MAEPSSIPDTLTSTVARTHEVIAERFATASTCRPTRERPRERFTATDPFLATTSRHVAAVNAVLAPAVRHDLADGRCRTQELARRSRSLEAALTQTKAKLYGSTFVVRRPWDSIWGEVAHELDDFRILEQDLVHELSQARDDDACAELAERLHRAEERVPTRPHPYLPHQGVAGRLARSVAARVDRFWDTAEGRMVPEPVRPQRPAPGPVARYLLADPMVE